MKRYIKIIVFMIVILSCLFNSVYAYKPSFTPKDLTGKGGNANEIVKTGNEILSVISLVGSAISVIAITMLGIKYMLGSVEEKAEYKKTLLPYFIGAIFVFGATAIPGIIYNMFDK